MPVLIIIQLLRFIAALMVVFTHTYSHVAAAGGEEKGLFYLIGSIGYAGVDVFFVISGFIIWHTTRNTTGYDKILKFFYRRSTRIYTGYWPYLLIAIVLFYMLDSAVFERKDLWGSVLLYNYKVSDLILPVSWSLTYELYFYLVFAVLLFFTAKTRLNIIILFFFLVLTTQTLTVLLTETYTPKYYKDANLFIRFIASPFCLEFLAGCILAAYHKRIHLTYPILLFILFLSTSMIIYVQEFVIHDSLMKGYYRMWRVPLVGTAAIALVLLAIRLEKNGKFLFPNISIIMGNISYSLYLSHTIILSALYYAGFNQFIIKKGSADIFYLIVIVGIIIYSGIHYYMVEKPLRKKTLSLIEKQ